MFKIESDFGYKGYRCVTIFTDMGYRCGYVGLTPKCKLYGKKYSDYLDIPISELDDKPIGKRGMVQLIMQSFEEDKSRTRMDVYFDIHGGLTFGGNHHPIDCELWWLGFDCGHYGDKNDLEMLEELWSDDEIIRSRIKIEKAYSMGDDGIIRDLDYVRGECMSLVDQIIELEERL